MKKTTTTKTTKTKTTSKPAPALVPPSRRTKATAAAEAPAVASEQASPRPKRKSPPPRTKPHSRLKDMTGEIVQRMRVLERNGNDVHGSALWKVQCMDCGETRTMAGIALRDLSHRRQEGCLPRCMQRRGLGRPLPVVK